MSKNETARIEAFSDGVFAIAATLLVLEIKVPQAEGQGFTPIQLWHELARLWPSYLAFVLSFGGILVMWVNHHKSFKIIGKSSSTFIFANGFLLMMVTFIPFPTAFLAEYINTPNASVAVIFYNGACILMSLSFNLFWESVKRPVYLPIPEFTAEHLRRLNRSTRTGLATYSFAFLVSFWSPLAGMIINSSLWLLWVTLQIGSR
jgi:uncharacterized membrane protein